MDCSSPVLTALSERLPAWGLTSECLPRFSAFYDGLMQANQTMNLTRITDQEDFWSKHIWDTLTLLPWLPPESQKLLDLGTGGGIPGIPLWLARPELKVTLLDSVGKKLRALEQITQQLLAQFPELKQRPLTLHQRAETAGRDKAHREQYELVVSRAVASLPVLLEYALPLVKRGGRFIAMKGPQYASEIDNLNQIAGLLGGRLAETELIELPGEQQRVLLVFEKRSLTPKTLPREAGQPQKQPLSILFQEA